MNLSPAIEPLRYRRGRDDDDAQEIQRFIVEGVDKSAVENDPRARLLDDGWIVYYGDVGEVYLKDGHLHVKEALYRQTNMVLLREYVGGCVLRMEDAGIIEGVSVEA